MKKIISLLTSYFSRRTLIRISYLLCFIVRPFYIGNKVFCPICEKHFRKFLPYGHGKTKDNRLCPKCLSLERHRLLYLYLQNKTSFFTEKLKVLHFAPEQPFINRFKALNNLDYISADLDSPIADMHLDVTNLTLPDNSFDFVICNHVLEHVSDAHRAMTEILRVLKPGGQAIMLVPINPDINTFEDISITNPKERERLFGQYDHVRQFGKDYAEYIKNAGFELIESKIYYDYSEEERKKMQLARKGEELIYGGIKAIV